jgi:hypothetical protein
MTEWFRPYEDRTVEEALEALALPSRKWGYNSLQHTVVSKKQKESVIQFIQDWNSLPPQVQEENLQGLGELKHITNEEAKQIILNNSLENIPPTKLIAIYSKEIIFINFNYIHDEDKLQYYILYTRSPDTVKSIQGVNWHSGIELDRIVRDNHLWEFYEWNGKSTQFMNWTEKPF